MKLIHLALLVFVSCGDNSDATVAPASSPPPPTPTQEAHRNMNKPATPEACTTRQCLVQNEGELIDVEGTYIFPKQQAFAVNKLALKDGTTVVLSPPKNELRDHFATENDGVTMRIRGRIFTGKIPEKYRIIGRTAEPHLLELEAIEKLTPPKAGSSHANSED